MMSHDVKKRSKTCRFGKFSSDSNLAIVGLSYENLMDIVTLTILKILKKFLSFCVIDCLGKMGLLNKIGKNFYLLDGSTGENLELSTNRWKWCAENEEIFDRCVKFLTHRCKTGPGLLLAQS